ncbi:MAG: hypothetical protein GT589_05430 [Peptoclostridium sp.]|uniref:hypothetical protein n=1 Tax=Peptoclostridium sp. TaxID=1904860 RepID=UPI00139EFBE1|nr:hypothetical protein [Peptoclostridium sp.]MZQ75586.1 hypothetical protein [Peptoclostridium sp.]
MKIQSQSLKSIESRLEKGARRDELGISKGMEIRATVVDSSLSKVRIMLENGRQLSAKTSVPFENFINEKLVFKVLADEGGLVIRPKLQDANIRHELDMKVSKLIASLGLQDNQESREIVRDMMKLEIPVTKNNFQAISENIKSLEILKMLDKDEVAALKSTVAKAESMELRELGKLVIAESKGENLKGLLDILKAASAGRDELLFMFKNGIKLNVQNTINMSGINDGSVNIATVLEQLGEGLQNMAVSNETPQIKIKNELVRIMENIVVDFSKEETPQISNKRGLDSLTGKLEELIKADINKAEGAGELESAFGKLQLLSELGKAEGYFQLPLRGQNENHVAQLLVKRERKREQGESERYSALIAIGTSNLGNVACKVGYSASCGYDVEFSLEDERTVRLFKASARAIDKSLSELGGMPVRTSFRLAEDRDDRSELIGNSRDTIQEMPNFDMWV